MQKLIRLQIAKHSTVSQRLIQTASGRCPGGIRTVPGGVRTAPDGSGRLLVGPVDNDVCANIPQYDELNFKMQRFQMHQV